MTRTNLRDAAWERLERESFDLVVIGGGVIGAATARDASLRGLRVALIEGNDIASGTSSRSSKLIHGGLRYLEQGDLPLVFESVSERRVMMRVAPHLVRPLGFLFPIYERDPVRLATLRLGLIVYEGLALFRSPKRHRTLSSDDVIEEVPALRREGLRGGPLYWDCATDDARLTLENALDAQRAGAVILTHARVTDLLHDERGKVAGVQVRDVLDGADREVEVHAASVVNATGPWSDRVRSMGEQDSHQLRLTKGVHLVFPASRAPIRHAIVCFHPSDHRVLFLIPWGDQVYLGTTDTDYEGDPSEVRATRDDVDYLLDALEQYLPDLDLRHEEITATWAGLRALIRAEGVPPSQVSREHVITDDPDGLISVAGGKLTTHRRIGDEVVDQVVKWLDKSGRGHPSLSSVNTAQLPLPGGVGWPEDDDGTEMGRQVYDAASGRLTREVCRYLADRYGSRAIALVREAGQDPARLEPLVPGRPEIVGQVDWAVRHELACTVTDFLERRTQLFFRDVDQGLGAVDLVADRMAALLGWSDAQREASIARYRDVVARSRAWRDDDVS